ncbi:MAG: class I SAM-dependent methyltransferase [Flavobacteriales bacterium]|nr:class I SAM-dependent methyltransferase [Flavobacteriales bacterium]
MNDLERYFNENKGRLIHKWMHFFDAYDRHFARYRGKEVVVLEIGVFHGGSMQMWKSYFGDKAVIHGVDVNPRCKELEEDRVRIHIGSQSDRAFLRRLRAELPPIDIIIDDGGHTMDQQIITFEELYGAVKPDGVYLCEDLHTSYWLQYGGGHKRPGTFIEYAKDFIDRLNAWHSEERSLQVDAFTRSTASVHFYDSIVVLEKHPREAPVVRMSGTPSFDMPEPRAKGVMKRIRLGSLRAWNMLLRAFGLPSVIWGR